MDLLSAFAVLDPKGWIALAERTLMLQATLFMLIVAVPVFALTFFFAWHYRAGNKSAHYTPDWEHSKMEELIWWAIPFEIVLVLGALTWTSTHELDPPKPIGDAAPLVVQVVALDWKWLFIYPEQGIATVNYIQMPVGRPVRFELTSDAPMNSFWIPQLGGQLYAMTGMVNTLNLIASEEGEFAGMSANYSGEGFAQMKFMAEATSLEEFNQWVLSAKASSRFLTYKEYEVLARPSIGHEVTYYAGVEDNLYDTIVMQFTHGMSGSREEGKTWPSGPERALPYSHE